MTVYLVGAGPGDPGLLTCRAEALLGRADVVVHDRLVSDEVLALAGAAPRVSVGKTPGRPGISQAEINDRLVELGREHDCVIRLKGGDPYVFGRGGEEAEALRRAGVSCEVVPGVTAAFAAPAAAGIPVMARDLAASVTVVTGHEHPGKGESDTVDWRELARTGGTLVVMMGVAHLPTIVRELQAGGLPSTTPVAAIHRGTLPDQHVVHGTLATIADRPITAPATIVIGAVAALDAALVEGPT